MSAWNLAWSCPWPYILPTADLHRQRPCSSRRPDGRKAAVGQRAADGGWRNAADGGWRNAADGGRREAADKRGRHAADGAADRRGRHVERLQVREQRKLVAPLGMGLVAHARLLGDQVEVGLRQPNGLGLTALRRGKRPLLGEGNWRTFMQGAHINIIPGAKQPKFVKLAQSSRVACKNKRNWRKATDWFV